MKLYFVRHGEAGFNGTSDFNRQLTEKGMKDSAKIGTFFTLNGITFTFAFVSPLVRAKQTASLILSGLISIPAEETEFLTPTSDPKNLFAFLRSYTKESKILFVTHEPFVGDCISALISGSESAHIVMKPASIACVETEGAPDRGNGRLLWLATPEILFNLP